METEVVLGDFTNVSILVKGKDGQKNTPFISSVCRSRFIQFRMTIAIG